MIKIQNRALAKEEMAADDEKEIVLTTPHVNSLLYNLEDTSTKADKLNRLVEEQELGLKILVVANMATELFPAIKVKKNTIYNNGYIRAQFSVTHLPPAACSAFLSAVLSFIPNNILRRCCNYLNFTNSDHVVLESFNRVDHSFYNKVTLP